MKNIENKVAIIILLAALLTITALSAVAEESTVSFAESQTDILTNCVLMSGTETDRDFVLNNTLQIENIGDIHFNLRVPESYDGTTPYALHIALPGWEGMYFQGIGEDVRWEYVPFESTEYVPDMIVASVQYNERGNDAANRVIALTEYLLASYRIDPQRVYITGYSLGGVTLSNIVALRPDLFRRALFVSSQWDGDPIALVEARIPLYLFTSAHDSYYGAEPARRAYQHIHDLYVSAGLPEEEISALLVLDVREDAWFDQVMEASPERTSAMYATDYHGAGMLVAFDKSVMTWVFQ